MSDPIATNPTPQNHSHFITPTESCYVAAVDVICILEKPTIDTSKKISDIPIFQLDHSTQNKAKIYSSDVDAFRGLKGMNR